MAFIYGLREGGISSLPVLRALETVPRELFVPHRYIDLAWRSVSLPIPCGQTMPRPFALARTLEALELSPGHRVLEIGTGSGYAAAVASRLAGEVVSHEWFAALHAEASARLSRLGFSNINVRCGDGLTEAALAGQGQFERILVHAALDDIPGPLLAALAPGGLIAFARRAGPLHQAGIYLAQPAAGASGAETLIVDGHYCHALGQARRD